MNKHKEKNILLTNTIILLIIYLIALLWIILFKLSFNLESLPHIRNINLIPFSQSFGINEIMNNVIIFIPFGILISMLKTEWSFFKKIIPIFSTSLILEILQYLLYIGASDITDIITNTLGGIIGIGLVYIFVKIFKEKALKILNVLSIIACIIIVLFVGVLIVINL